MWSQLWPGDTQPRRPAAEFLNLHVFIVHFWGVSIWLWNVSPQASEVSMIKKKFMGVLGHLSWVCTREVGTVLVGTGLLGTWIASQSQIPL